MDGDHPVEDLPREQAKVEKGDLLQDMMTGVGHQERGEQAWAGPNGPGAPPDQTPMCATHVRRMGEIQSTISKNVNSGRNARNGDRGGERESLPQ